MDRRQTIKIRLAYSEDSKNKPFTIRGYVAEMKKKNPELCSPFAPKAKKAKNPVDEKQPTPTDKPATSGNEIA
nr:uncharacterized protein LOC109167907 [Ipomoea trifida]